MCFINMQYAEQYGAGDPVHMDLQLPLFTPETDDRLGRLEARHQILDTYVRVPRPPPPPRFPYFPLLFPHCAVR